MNFKVCEKLQTLFATLPTNFFIYNIMTQINEIEQEIKQIELLKNVSEMLYNHDVERLNEVNEPERLRLANDISILNYDIEKYGLQLKRLNSILSD